MVVEDLAPSPSGVDVAAWGAACAAVRAYCGWHIAPSVAEEVTIDGSGGSVEFLPTLHLTALTSITSDGSTVPDPEWSEAGMVRKGSGCWTRKYRGVVAEITHGYDECPPEVFKVVAEMVAVSALGGISQVTSGSHQARFEPSLSSRQQDLLDHYRLVSLS